MALRLPQIKTPGPAHPAAPGEARQLRVKPAVCIGCRTCEIACAFSHPSGDQTGRSRIRAYPGPKPETGIPVVCLQCDAAACVSVCPTETLTRNEATGAIDVRSERCVSCRACVYACPFGNISFDERSRHTVKCDLCGGDPECAKYCPTGALSFR